MPGVRHRACALSHADTRTTLTTYAGLIETDRPKLRSDLAIAFASVTSKGDE